MSIVIKEKAKRIVENKIVLVFLELIVLVTFIFNLILYSNGEPVSSVWVGGNSVTIDSVNGSLLGYIVIITSYLANAFLIYGLLISLDDSEEFVVPISIGLLILAITNFLIGLFHSFFFDFVFLLFILIKNKDVNSRRMADFSIRKLSFLLIGFMIFVFTVVLFTITLPTEEESMRTYLYFDMFILFFGLFGLLMFQQKYFIINAFFFSAVGFFYVSIYWLLGNYVMFVSSFIYAIIFLFVFLSKT